jgi:hypothetical protein
MTWRETIIRTLPKEWNNKKTEVISLGDGVLCAANPEFAPMIYRDGKWEEIKYSVQDFQHSARVDEQISEKKFEFIGKPSEDCDYGCLHISYKEGWDNNEAVISVWDNRSCHKGDPHVFEKGKKYKVTVTIEEIE